MVEDEQRVAHRQQVAAVGCEQELAQAPVADHVEVEEVVGMEVVAHDRSVGGGAGEQRHEDEPGGGGHAGRLPQRAAESTEGGLRAPLRRRGGLWLRMKKPPGYRN